MTVEALGLAEKLSRATGTCGIDIDGLLAAYLNELDAQLYQSIIELRGYELLRSDALDVPSR